MTLKEYRKVKGLTQPQLADELNDALGIGYDVPTISRIESGKVLPTQNVQFYIDAEISEKALASRSDERKVEKWVTLPPAEEKPLKSAIFKNWNSRGLTQNERVIAFIEAFGSITSKEAFDLIGVTRLASRICDLSKMGYRFERKSETAENRYGDKVSYTRYSLENDDGKTNVDRQ